MSESHNPRTPPLYTPLHLPDEDVRQGDEKPQTLLSRLKDYYRNEYGLSRKAQYLVDQMRTRGPIPEEVWGPDARRREMAKTIAEIVRDEIGWPNANFIPEDPFKLVAFSIQSDGTSMDFLEVDCAMLRLANLIGFDYYDDVVWNTFWESTLGEVVDILVKDASDTTAAIRKVSEWSREGPKALESLPCTAPAIFFDLRAFIVQGKYGVPTSMLRLTTPLREIFNVMPSHELQHYLVRRFGVGCGKLFPDFDPNLAVPSVLGCLILLILPVFVLCTLIITIADTVSMPEKLASWLGIAFLCVMLFMWHPLERLRAVREKIAPKPPKTMKDLVLCIQRERAKQGSVS